MKPLSLDCYTTYEQSVLIGLGFFWSRWDNTWIHQSASEYPDTVFRDDGMKLKFSQFDWDNETGDYFERIDSFFNIDRLKEYAEKKRCAKKTTVS